MNDLIEKKQKEVLDRIRKRSIVIEKQAILQPEIKELKLAVTEAGYDDMGAILKKLDYEYTIIGDPDISDYNTLRKYNALFINCERGGNPTANQESLRTFAQNGGIIYISDRSAPQISAAFPNFIEFSSGGKADQWVDAIVTNKELGEIIGSKIKIYFDLDNWIPIERVNANVQVFLTGSFKTNNAYKENKPILASFKYGNGEIIYTSFHNHRQTTEKEEKLLKFFILKPISTLSKIPIVKLAQSKGLIPLTNMKMIIVI